MTDKRANPLQAAILATFAATPDEHIGERLAAFRLRDWKRLGAWIHASGLALYFLEEVRNRGLHGAIPGDVLEELEQNQLDNRERTEELMREFVLLNIAFHSEGLDYVNVKGFSLGREYCASPALRSQFDLDFWLRRDQTTRCKLLMKWFGYEIVSEGSATLEFRAGGSGYPSLRDFYKPRRQRMVEIHLRDPEEMDSLPRAKGVLKHFVFPTLSRERAFLQQASHVTKHLRHEWTRASWMLELRNAITHNFANEPFWRCLRGQAVSPDCATMVGIAVLATTTIFQSAIPAQLSGWTTDVLPMNVARWVTEYAERVVSSSFPGSKLYLLLDRELARNYEEYRRHRHLVLMPGRMPSRTVVQSRRSFELKTLVPYVRYAAVRCAFHVRESIRLLQAEREWRNDIRCECVDAVGQGSGAGSVLGRIQ